MPLDFVRARKDDSQAPRVKCESGQTTAGWFAEMDWREPSGTICLRLRSVCQDCVNLLQLNYCFVALDQ